MFKVLDDAALHPQHKSYASVASRTLTSIWLKSILSLTEP